MVRVVPGFQPSDRADIPQSRLFCDHRNTQLYFLREPDTGQVIEPVQLHHHPALPDFNLRGSNHAMNTSIVFLGDPLIGMQFTRGYLEGLLGKIIPNPSPNSRFLSGTFTDELLKDNPRADSLSLVRQLHIWGAKLREQGIRFDCCGPEWGAVQDGRSAVDRETHPFWQNNLDMSMEGDIVLLFAISQSKAPNGTGILQNLRLREKRGLPIYTYMLYPDYNASIWQTTPARISLDRSLITGDGRVDYTAP